MKDVKKLSLALLFALLCAPTFAAADAREGERDQRIISARAGGVNFVSGDVRVRRDGSAEWRALTTEDELKNGDLVRTGAAGRVEVLLNPGSYFRAGSGSEFTMAETGLDGLRVELTRGSVVVEAMGYSSTDLSIAVATPRGVVRIIRSGVYRVNALEDGGAELAVFEGRAMLNGIVVKGGSRARSGAAGVEAAKFDKKKSRDELDLWSRERGKELAKANESITARSVNTLFARSSFDPFFGQYGSQYHSGFWFFNSRTRCYTFLPYGANWRSPYGYWYGTGLAYPSQWGRGYGGYPGQNTNPGYTPPSTSGGGGTGSAPAPPPSSGGGGSNGGGGFGGGSAAPTRPTTDRDRMPTGPRVDRVDPGSVRPRDQR